ncbi:MAG TPA: beta-galactosidase trimerization domain-containing protein [Acidimicrobiales bacterium]
MRFRSAGGRLTRDGQPFLAVGVDWHPSYAGCGFWRDWRPERVASDLRGMAAAGFTTVRFFVFWADVEPEEGRYDEVVVGRVRELVEEAGRHGLACVPSLLTIWMNGQLFDPPWRRGRSLWTDPDVVAREEAYVAHVAGALAGLDNVLAYDLGDEVMHVDTAESARLPREAVRAWHTRLADAIRRAHPGALVLQANEASGVVGAHGFGPDNAEGLDLVGIHGFPTWSPFAIESTLSYRGTSFVPFLVRVASAFGTPLVDELGSYGTGEEVAAAYLRAVAPAALAAGANGLLVWCWQDIASTAKPYVERPTERFVGLLDLEGRPKPAFAELAAVARDAADWAGLEVPPSPVAVYLPELYRVPEHTYLQADASGAPGLFGAYLLAKRAHLPVEFAREPAPHHRLLVCPSLRRITLPDQERLTAFVRDGGTLLYSPGDHLHGYGGEELFGVRTVDFTVDADAHGSFTWQGTRHDLDWSALGARPHVPVIAATSAEVLATFPDGSPALTRKAVGRGTALYLNAPFEALLDRPHALEAGPCERLYRDAAALAGVTPEADCDRPEVELTPVVVGGRRAVVAVNHGVAPVTTTVTATGPDGSPAVFRLSLDAKGVEVLTLDVPAPATSGSRS